MIGRFSQAGVYRELAESGKFYRIAFAGGLALASYLWDRGSEHASAAGITLAVVSLILNGLPVIWSALKGLIKRKTNVDELVSIAIIASVVMGEFLTAAFVSFVMVLGSLIEEITGDSARKTIESLIKLSPEKATIVENNETREIALSEIKPGNLLLVKPGERIPVDGTVKEGFTSVDESSITGEAIPVEKKPGDSLYAGTLNQNGLLRVEVTRVGKDTTLGKVIKLVSDAESHKPRVIKTIDGYASWFTPTILFCAGLTWLITGEVRQAVTVLIVGCPCALILAAPTAIVAAIGRAAKSGILIKGGSYLEEAGRAEVILFDKTGTLTEGKPKVDKIITIEGEKETDVLTEAASIEAGSTHPFARAILKAAHYAKITLSRAEEVFTEIGMGVRGQIEGKLIEVGSAYIGGGSINLPSVLLVPFEEFKKKGTSPLIVYREKEPVGIINVSDTLRPSAGETVKKLKSLGFEHLGILSGDHKKSVELVAEEIGLTDIWPELKPEDKLEIIERYQKEGKGVIFVGDGINDAPALAKAGVGIAMGAAGTDIALETSDIALMHDDISKLPFLIDLSRKTLRIIKWNIVFGMIFNAIAVIAGGWGLFNPVMGAVVHNIGSVMVVLSSASLAFTSEK